MAKIDYDKELRTFLPRFWKLLLPYRSLTYKALYWIFVMQVLALAEPSMVMYVIDGITGKRPLFRQNLLPLMAAMFVGLSAIGIAQVFKNRRIREVWFAIERHLPVACGEKLLRLPLTYHQTENTGAIVGKVVRGVGRYIDVTGILLWEIIPLLVQSVVTVALLLWFSVPAALVLLPIVMIFGWMTARIKMRLAATRMQRHEMDGDADDKLGQAVTNAMTTQAFSQEEREIATVKAIREHIHTMAHDEFRAYDASDYLRNSIISLGRVGVIFVCARAALGGSISMGMLVFISTLAEKVFVSCYRIGAVFDRLMEAAEPVMRMSKLFDEPETVVDSPTARMPERLTGDIAFEHVTFAYKTRAATANKPALSDVTITVRSGETLGIVGESGGGKSTLVKLLLRFGDPDQGSVTIDGHDLHDMPMREFRRQIGYVPQEVEIYDLTVAENIAYGRPDATREDVEKAARIANAHDFIMTLPNGYDEVVGNRGLRLSGGQRQRVGIARAVLLDPPILVFDEATSHVDVVSEKKIHASIEELRRGKTVLIIAHRLSTVQDADRIVVIDEGRVRETGSHQELIDQGGIYRHLVELQTKIEATA